MTIAIALTKGRLEKASIAMLKKEGYGVEALKEKGRTLVFEDTQKDIRYFLVKPNDCITYVQHGVADIGIVGKDTLMEGSDDYYELLDLNIGKCRFILGGLKGHNPFDKLGHITIGTKYPNVAKAYFMEKGREVECIKIDGSVELAPLLGLCDGIVDIMETGDTLRENGLVVFDTLCELSARVIVNKASLKLKQTSVCAVLEDLQRGREAC